MDLHERKPGRIAFPATADVNVRSCMPTFYTTAAALGKPPCSLPANSMQVQDALIPIQHSTCSTQVFSFDQSLPPPVLTHEALNQPPDIEYITLPVYKTRKNEPLHYNQTDLSIIDGRFRRESNTTFDLRTIQNLSYSTVPEPRPYFCLAQTNLLPRNPGPRPDAQKFAAFQPPPRSPRREFGRVLIPRSNRCASYAEKNCDEKVEESFHYPKNFTTNFQSRRLSNETQFPAPFRWIETNAKQKTIPEKGDLNLRRPFRRRQDCEMFPDEPDDDKRRIISSVRDNYPRVEFNKLSSAAKFLERKRLHDDRKVGRIDSEQKKNSGTKLDQSRENPDSYLSPLNFSTTSRSSSDSLSQHSSRKHVKCSCSEESDHNTKSKRSSLYSIGNQTEFLKSPLEEKFLFRETILFGCDEIGKWARKLPMVSEILDMGDYVREKTTQSRAQNICSAQGLEIEDQVIVSGYLKVFLKVADSWLEARNCFGLTENCVRKACQLNSPEIARNYLEWQHASRRLLGNIIHGVGSVLAAKDAKANNESYANDSGNAIAKADCRLTRSASNLQKYTSRFTANKRPFLQRQKWTISDNIGASNVSQCSRLTSGNEIPENLPRFANPDYHPETHAVMLTDFPQYKITPLSQIEPPCLRKPENSCTTVDISAWFKNGDNRCVLTTPKEGTANRFAIPPSQLKPGKVSVQKSQSAVAVSYGGNDGSQDSSDEVQQKVYMKPGSYNVPKKKLTQAKKKNNMQKAKESCCGDTDMPRGYVIPFVNAGPFVPPPSRSLQNPNIKMVKNASGNAENAAPIKCEENLKLMTKSDEKNEERSKIKNQKTPEGNSKPATKTMKTDEWILSTLINSQALKPQTAQEEDGKEKRNVRNPVKTQLGNEKPVTSDGLISPNAKVEDRELNDDRFRSVEAMTNRSQNSIHSRSIGEIEETRSRSKRRCRGLDQRTRAIIEEIVDRLGISKLRITKKNLRMRIK